MNKGKRVKQQLSHFIDPSCHFSNLVIGQSSTPSKSVPYSQPLSYKSKSQPFKYCMFCTSEQHTIDQCRKKKAIDLQASSCSFCHKSGHTIDQCWVKATKKTQPSKQIFKPKTHQSQGQQDYIQETKSHHYMLTT
eukprot:c1678_g1_i1 orf=140-544(+)